MLNWNDNPTSDRPVAFVVIRDENQDSFVKSPVARQAITLIEKLRGEGIPVIYNPSGGASKQLQRALEKKPFAAVFLGTDDLAQASVQLKLIDERSQSPCKWDELIPKIRSINPKLK